MNLRSEVDDNFTKVINELAVEVKSENYGDRLNDAMDSIQNSHLEALKSITFDDLEGYLKGDQLSRDGRFLLILAWLRTNPIADEKTFEKLRGFAKGKFSASTIVCYLEDGGVLAESPPRGGAIRLASMVIDFEANDKTKRHFLVHSHYISNDGTSTPIADRSPRNRCFWYFVEFRNPIENAYFLRRIERSCSK